ncbi:hypothetical protein BJV85_002925 [Clostridium acetobutylicum]|nr:hypothetical protein [Clostridium acetobutylicum]NOW15577.1 hypothetical protein [Clostridium acetobutylicum]NRY57256.1 hypothetical protein [Clostridium acetobutylicum]NSA94002.1 hypothetical protein [Clostridium acetobutylicum]NYC95139.1 hypothetical protein [Clostridium acetobutylicum]
MPNVESVKRDIQALGKSGQEAIFCTDSHKSYIQFA